MTYEEATLPTALVGPVERRVRPHATAAGYGCILADPPWALTMAGQRKRAKEGKKPEALPYPTMTIAQICDMPVGQLATEDAHLWLWTTNQHLEDGFKVMRAWGFKYLAPVHWVKPTGMGNWFVHRTQTMLFGYREKCRFPLARYRPNVFHSGDPKRHSEKPEAAYELVEAVSPGPRLELFARRKRNDWHTWGNEVPCDVFMGPNVAIKPRRQASA